MPTESAITNTDARQTPSPFLVARDVHKTYHLDRIEVKVLKGASIEVSRGEWVAVLGASGSGKSTLLHLLGGLDRPDRTGGSSIQFEGKELSQLKRKAMNIYRNRSVGFVFQFYHLLPELTVTENAMIPAMIGVNRLQFIRERSTLRKRAEALLESFGLAHRFNHRPRELSGGERQRVAIARALINQPLALLADEPTGNLDEETGGEILELLTEQHRTGLTIVMVTHDRSVADRADRIVELHNGCVAH